LLAGLRSDMLQEAEEVFQMHRKHEETLAKQELELATLAERKRALMRRFAQLDERCRSLADTGSNDDSSSSRYSPPVHKEGSNTKGPGTESVAAVPSHTEQQQRQQQQQQHQHRTQLAELKAAGASVSTAPAIPISTATVKGAFPKATALSYCKDTDGFSSNGSRSTASSLHRTVPQLYSDRLHPYPPTAREQAGEGTLTAKQQQQQQQQQDPWQTCVGCGKEGPNGLWAVVADCDSFVVKLQEEDVFEGVVGKHSCPCESWESLAACLVQEANELGSSTQLFKATLGVP